MRRGQIWRCDTVSALERRIPGQLGHAAGTIVAGLQQELFLIRSPSSFPRSCLWFTC